MIHRDQTPDWGEIHALAAAEGSHDQCHACGEWHHENALEQVGGRELCAKCKKEELDLRRERFFADCTVLGEVVEAGSHNQNLTECFICDDRCERAEMFPAFNGRFLICTRCNRDIENAERARRKELADDLWRLSVEMVKLQRKI